MISINQQGNPPFAAEFTMIIGTFAKITAISQLSIWFYCGKEISVTTPRSFGIAMINKIMMIA